MGTPLYPFTFKSLHEGGPAVTGLLRTYLSADDGHGDMPDDTARCWQLVDSDTIVSTIANGPLAGQSLRDVTAQAPQDIVGRRHRPNASFPLCISLRDVGRTDPLTVCPESTTHVGEREFRPNNRFIYSLDSTPDARILAGMGQSSTRTQFLASLNQQAMRRVVQEYIPRPHDAFFSPSGRVQCVGAGNLVLELSDHGGPPLIVSVWDDDQKRPSDEDLQAALEAIYLQDRHPRRISREEGRTRCTRRIPIIRHCPSFNIEEIRLLDHLFDHTAGRTYHALVLIRGKAHIETDGAKTALPLGGVCVIPAAMGDYRLYADSDEARLLRIALQTY
ncbi:MAG: hypothetical protein KAI66_06250 [Lentisphaeria bacterium]|nr:hypothetical protein [Lentisphaeria bacterium]